MAKQVEQDGIKMASKEENEEFGSLKRSIIREPNFKERVNESRKRGHVTDDFTYDTIQMAGTSGKTDFESLACWIVEMKERLMEGVKTGRYTDKARVAELVVACDFAVAEIRVNQARHEFLNAKAENIGLEFAVDGVAESDVHILKATQKELGKCEKQKVKALKRAEEKGVSAMKGAPRDKLRDILVSRASSIRHEMLSLGEFKVKEAGNKPNAKSRKLDDMIDTWLGTQQVKDAGEELL